MAAKASPTPAFETDVSRECFCFRVYIPPRKIRTTWTLDGESIRINDKRRVATA